MCDKMKLVNVKDHLKQGTFKSMINQKCCTSQHQWGKMLINEVLKIWLKKLNLSAKDVFKTKKKIVLIQNSYASFRMLLTILQLPSNLICLPTVTTRFER